MKTKLIILGSGNSMGVPKIDGSWGNCNKRNKKNIRTRCAAIILKGNNSILIDTSPDIKNQLIANKIKNLSSVIYTHEHADQTSGLFELRPFFWKYKKKINIYGNLKTINHLKKRFDYCFKSFYGYPAIVKGNIIKKIFSLRILLNFSFISLLLIKKLFFISIFSILNNTSLFFEIKLNSLGLNVDKKISTISNKIIL